jgi:hypothetical protein
MTKAIDISREFNLFCNSLVKSSGAKFARQKALEPCQRILKKLPLLREHLSAVSEMRSLTRDRGYDNVLLDTSCVRFSKHLIITRLLALECFK